MTIMDVALLKTLPNIKGPLIRFLYDSAINNPAFPHQNYLKLFIRSKFLIHR